MPRSKNSINPIGLALAGVLQVAGLAHAWTPPSAISGIEPNMPLPTVVSRLGEPDRCWQSQHWCAWENADEQVLSIQFEDGLVRYLFAQIGFNSQDNLPFTDVSGMRAVLGEPDVYAVSGTGWRTRYTYLDSGLTINVDEGQVTGFTLGYVGWRVTATLSEYWVAGRQLCPSGECPFDLPTNQLKDSFLGQTVADWLVTAESCADHFRQKACETR